MTVYSCRNMPTIQEFFASDAFVRGLMGPFGCLSGDSEFLTPRGWKRMDAYQDGDLVLEWRPNGCTRWVRPNHYIDTESGKLLLFEAGHLKMALSPEHRVPHINYAGRFTVAMACEIVQSTARKEIPTTFMAPEAVGLDMSDDMIRFAVMMQADGHYVPQGHQAVVTVRKERKKTRIRQLLAALSLDFDERVYDGRPTESRFVFYPPYRGKRFGPEWYGANQDQLAVVLDEVQYWDSLFGSAERIYFSNIKENADFVQYAAHACGLRASICPRVVPEKDNWNTTYAVHIRAGDNIKNRASIREHTAISLIDAPGGRKYCFTVPSGFFVARYRDTVFCTGNSGKSSACVMEIAQRGVAQKPLVDGVRRTRWAVVRNSYRQLEDTTIRTFMQWLPPHHYGEWFPSKHQYTVKNLKHEGDDRGAEIEVLFRALDRPDQLGNLLSMELTGAWVNEGREVPWAIMEALEGRVGRYPSKSDGGPSWFGVFADTNPPDVDSSWFKYFEETDHREKVEELAKVIPGMTVDKYRQIFKQPSGLAPTAENLAHLPEGYYQRLAIGKSDEWNKVFVHGEYGFVIDGKAVFPEYIDALHCPTDKAKWPKPVADLPVVRSWDFGLTPACIFSQITPRGQWIVFDEMVSTRMGADNFSDEVIEHSARYYNRQEFWDVGDPAGGQASQTDEKTCFNILRGKGIAIEPGLQTLAIRLESVRKPLRTLVDGRPQFVMHPRCTQLRRAMMGGFHFRRMRISGERYTESPEKNSYSHPADALCYAGTRLFGAGLYLPRGAANDRQSEGVGRRSSITGY